MKILETDKENADIFLRIKFFFEFCIRLLPLLLSYW